MRLLRRFASVAASLALLLSSSVASGGLMQAETPPPPAREHFPAKRVPGALTPDGWGPLRIGMTMAQAIAAVGPDKLLGEGEQTPTDGCQQIGPSRGPGDMALMFIDGVLTHISVYDRSKIRTDRGIRIGDSEAKVRAAYGSKITKGPHLYLPAPAGFMVAWYKGGSHGELERDSRGILYEIDQFGRVMAIQSGGPTIQFFDGCPPYGDDEPKGV